MIKETSSAKLQTRATTVKAEGMSVWRQRHEAKEEEVRLIYNLFSLAYL